MEVSFQIESAAISDRGLSQKRPQNEDSFLEINEKGIFAVADGVGGAQAGEVASQMAVEILGEAFTNFHQGSDAERVMRLALEQANSAIHQMSNDLAQLSKMATTVVALHVEGNIATIGHVGDSRLYRLDSSGTLHRETDDHSMVAEEVRAGRMTEEQADNHPSKNIISRALGAERNVEIDLKTMMVGGDSTFLLCSDGVTRHIGDAEIAELLVGRKPLDSICERVKVLCYQRGAEDNLTAVIVRLSSIAGMQEKPPNSLLGENRQGFLTMPELDEETVATARTFKTAETSEEEDDFLELDTVELKLPTSQAEPFTQVPESVQTIVDGENEDDSSLHETIPASSDDTFPSIETEIAERHQTSFDRDQSEVFKQNERNGEAESNEVLRLQSSSVEPETTSAQAISVSAGDETFSIFGESDGTAGRESSSIGRILSYFGLLFAGALIGFGVYHFTLKPLEQTPVIPITEMRSGNIPLSAFEDNRRLVDSDPAAYLSKIPAPDDAESFYLQGRAFMLTGDFIKARAALLEARNRISQADPINAKVIVTDIAISLAITNDPTAQKNFKAELESAKPVIESNRATVR